jgi:hypothetical protein
MMKERGGLARVLRQAWEGKTAADRPIRTTETPNGRAPGQKE